MRRQLTVKEHLNRYFFTYVTTIICLYVFFQVDQITRIWQQGPPFGASAAVWVGYVGFLTFTITYFVLAQLEVIFRTSRIYGLRRITTVPYVGRAWLAGRMFSFDWLLVIVRSRPQWRLGIVLGCMVTELVIIFFGPAGDASPSPRYPLMGTLAHSAGVVLFLIGLWIYAHYKRAGQRTILGIVLVRGLVGLSTLRAITWLTTTLLLTELLWILASNSEWTGNLVSYRIYTIWACFAYFSIAIVVASVLDQWARRSTWPVRLVVFVLVAFFLWYDRAARVDRLEYQRHQSAARELSSSEAPPLLSYMNERLQGMPNEQGPVVIIAASGGGSRAAIFTSLVLETLRRTPLNEGPFHELGIAPPEANWASRILMISSVSGGSLASAHYVQSLPQWPAPLTDLAQTSRGELMTRMREQIRDDLATFLDNLREKTKNGGAKASADKDLFDGMQPFWSLVAPEGILLDADRFPPPDDAMVAKLKECKIPEQTNGNESAVQLKSFRDQLLGLQVGAPGSWELHSPAFDAMCTDFMAPILRGVLAPRLDRGDALARFWTERFRWHDSTNFAGYAQPGIAPRYDSTTHPAMLFNATDVLDGKRLVASFPPNGPNFWKPVYDALPPVRLTTMSEFDETFGLSLARAVRMSSNFPFGFRVMEIPRPDNEFSSPGRPARPPLHVLDGGVVDNTGLDTLYEAFRGFEFYERYLGQALTERDEFIKKRAQQGKSKEELEKMFWDTKPKESEFIARLNRFQVPLAAAEQAITFLQELRKRTIVLIEIDAGAKPAQKAGGPLEAITEPMNALNNAGYLNAELNKQFYINEIRRLLCRKPGESEHVPTVLHYRFACNQYDPNRTRTGNDVMTAWTLGPQDKSNVLVRFRLQLDRWDRERILLRNKLRDCDSIVNESIALKSEWNSLRNDFETMRTELTLRLVKKEPLTAEEQESFVRKSGQLQLRYERQLQQTKRLLERAKATNPDAAKLPDNLYAGIPGFPEFSDWSQSLKQTLAKTEQLFPNNMKAQEITRIAKSSNIPNVDSTLKLNVQNALDIKDVKSSENLGKKESKEPNRPMRKQ